jgi:hypothetical protein
VTYSDLAAYAPQKMFLIAGGEAFFESLLSSAREVDTFASALFVPRLTIDHAHDIATFLTEGMGEERIFIVYFAVFSPEAAQVLLKSLEEPDLATTLIFVTPHPYTVPQTIRSRVSLLQGEHTAQVLPFKNKIDAYTYIKEEFGGEAEDDAATKRARAVHLLNALEVHAAKDPVKAQSVYEAKHMLFRANMPTKYVLEYAVTMVL